MGDAARQCPDGFELLNLPQLGLELGFGRLHPALLGDVVHTDDDAASTSELDEVGAGERGAVLATGVLEFDLDVPHVRARRPDLESALTA